MNEKNKKQGKYREKERYITDVIEKRILRNYIQIIYLAKKKKIFKNSIAHRDLIIIEKPLK